jgi:tetratricopeptide (TPR) repeat protein
MDNTEKSKNVPTDKTLDIKEVVSRKDISLSNLFKYSFKLFLREPKKLIILEFSYAITISIYYILGSPSDFHLSFNILLNQIITMFVTSFGIVILTSAASDVYDSGKFYFKEVLVKGTGKIFKYVWTYTLLIFIFSLIIISPFLLTATLTALGIPRALPLLICYLVLIVLFIWAIVPLFFINYIIVCNDFYGLKSIKILFRMVRGRRCQLLWYQFVTIIFLVPSIPVFYLTIKGFRIASLLNIPLSVMWLYIRLYGLILYKHLVSKFDENNLGSFDVYDKWDTILRLDEIIRIKTNDAKLYNCRGYVYLDLARYDEAIEDFNTVSELDKKYKDTYVGLAIAYYRMGNKEKAVENYKKAIKLDKRYKRKIDELVKEGHSYLEKYSQIIREILMDIK